MATSKAAVGERPASRVSSRKVSTKSAPSERECTATTRAAKVAIRPGVRPPTTYSARTASASCVSS